MIDISKMEYKGWANSYRITNKKVELIILADVGPRVIRYGFVDGTNQFIEFPEHAGLVGDDVWRIYGGHRLWHSPENLVRTYYPDNQPIEVFHRENGLLLVQQEETSTKLQKKMEIEMDNETGAITVIHRIKNCGLWDIKLSAWAISAMAPGGLSILKQRTNSCRDICIPDMRISVWPGTSIKDHRVIWGNEYILLKQDSCTQRSFKIGVSSDVGWVAYANNRNLFVKYYEYDSNSQYPDFGSSVELYTCDRFSEIETLSPLRIVAPGSEIVHKEIWKLYQIEKSINDLLEEESLNSYIISCGLVNY
jgi:hypothetical protein